MASYFSIAESRIAGSCAEGETRANRPPCVISMRARSPLGGAAHGKALAVHRELAPAAPEPLVRAE